MLMPGEGDPVGDGLGDLGGVGKAFGGWPQSVYAPPDDPVDRGRGI